jgi:hypothetical protein
MGERYRLLFVTIEQGSTTAGRGREPPLGGRGFRRPALAPRAREDQAGKEDKPGKKTGKSMSLDVYSHVMRADEVSDKCLLALIEP